MPRVLLSHSHKDSSAAQSLSKTLERRGISVFTDVDTVVSGTDYSAEIADVISGADAVVLLLSRNSQRSKWVDSETAHALESKKIVVPVLLDAEAKENWIWPLVADRNAVQIDNNSDIEEIAESLDKAISEQAEVRVETPLTYFDRIVRRFVPSVWLDRLSGYDVFISYSHRDGTDYAQSIAANARHKGLTVFRDNDGIREGEDIPKRIVSALERARLLLIVATPGAVESKEVKKERELYSRQKTLFRADRPITVVYAGNEISIDLEGIKAISTDGTVPGVTNTSLAAINNQIGWATSLRRLYSGLLAVAVMITIAIISLGWSLSRARTEAIAQKWEAIAIAAEKENRYSEAEFAYRRGGDYAARLYAARLHEDAGRMITFRHLIPFKQLTKPKDSRCHFVTQLADGRIMAVFWFVSSSRVSIRIDSHEVAVLQWEPEASVDCAWADREDHEWTLAISDGERVWAVESAGNKPAIASEVFSETHANFWVQNDGTVHVMTIEDNEVATYRLKIGENPSVSHFRPGRHLVSESSSHVTKTTVLCGTFLPSGRRDAFVAVAAYPQSTPDRACQIDVFRLGSDENEFELIASLPLQSVIPIPNISGGGPPVDPYAEPLTAEGRVVFATDLCVSTDENAIAIQFVQGENFMVGKPFHVVMPAQDFSQNVSRTWQEAHELARSNIYLNTSVAESIFLVDNPIPAAVVYRNQLVTFIGLKQSPTRDASMATEAEYCVSTSILGNQSPILMNLTSQTLEAFKGEYRVRYALPDFTENSEDLDLHAGGSSLIVVESPNSLFCFRRWNDSVLMTVEDPSNGNGYVVDVDGHVTIPVFKKNESAN